MKTKLFTLFLALIIGAGTIFADGTKIGDLYYNLNADNKTAEVTYQEEWSETNYSYLTTINIPESVDYNSVTYSVTSIGEWAFAGCTGLTSVTCVRETPANLGNDVFYNTHANLKIYVPAGSVNTYKAGWAAYAAKIKAIPPAWVRDGDEWDDATKTLTVKSNLPENAYRNQDVIQHVIINNGVTSIGNYAFYGCSNVSSLKFHNKVTSIGIDAFYYCTGLTSVEILDSIAKIENDAFKGCTNIARVEISNLAAWSNIEFKNEYANPLYYAKHLYVNEEEIIDLDIPETVSCFKKYAFINCENLQSVTIPYSVEKIDFSAFSGCNNIKSVSINSDAVSGRTYWSDLNMSHVFGPQVKEYVFGDSVTSIGSYAFYECDSIDSFVFGENITDIGSYAFYSAGKFSRGREPLSETFTLPAKLTSIGAYAFFCWFRLNSLTIPDSVTSIYKAAFGGCINLAYLSIPSSLNYIGGAAFFGCNKLKSVTCKATTPPYLGGNENDPYNQVVFTNVDCENIPLFVPAESIEAYKEANQWSDFTHIYPIEYADNIETSNVSAIPNEDNSVTLTWPVVEETVIYTIEIKKNGELVCSLEFNADGQLISKVFAMPSRNGNRQTKSATQTANGWQYTIDGLDSGTEYTYTITAKKVDDTEVFTQTITFSTLSHEGIENIEANGDNTTKIINNGQIYIRRGDKTYTLQGQEVK